MPPNRPTSEVQTERETKAWRLRCRGLSVYAIAEQVGITRQGVEKLLKRVEARELVKLSKSVERVKVTNHHRLEHVIEESFGAWHESKKPLKRASRKTQGGLVVPGTDEEIPGEVVSATEVVERTGDTRYLQLGMVAMESQAKLWGLEVLPAANERASSISQLAEDMKARGDAYEARERAENPPDDPAGTPHGCAGGAEEVPAGPGPVQ